jgi:hypothetical protein
MVRRWVQLLAALRGGLAASLGVSLLQLKVQQENLQPTPLLKLVSFLLLGLDFALPWFLVSRWRHRRHS